MTTWSTDPSTGIVTVDFGSGLTTPVVTARSDLSSLKSKVIDQWGPLIAKYAAKNNIPFAHIAGLIRQESGGNASVVSADGGIGLMQITSTNLKAGHTNEELKDPELNIQIGSNYFGQLWQKYGGDLPRAAAAYNAGSARPCSPAIKSCNTDWGLVATPGHITGVVSASNTIINNGWDGVASLPDPLPTPLPSYPPVLTAGISTPSGGIGWFFMAATGAYFAVRWASSTRLWKRFNKTSKLRIR